MTWFGWLLVAVEVLGVMVTVAQIGEPRKPKSKGDAIGQLIVAGVLVLLILNVGTGKL